MIALSGGRFAAFVKTISPVNMGSAFLLLSHSQQGPFGKARRGLRKIYGHTIPAYPSWLYYACQCQGSCYQDRQLNIPLIAMRRDIAGGYIPTRKATKPVAYTYFRVMINWSPQDTIVGKTDVATENNITRWDVESYPLSYTADSTVEFQTF